MRNEYRNEIMRKMDAQIEKGLNKYGTTLEQNTGLSMEERLVHLQEELIDGLFYVEHLIAKDRQSTKHKQDLIGVISQMMVQLPMIQNEDTREIFLDIAKQFNGVVKEMI